MDDKLRYWWFVHIDPEFTHEDDRYWGRQEGCESGLPSIYILFIHLEYVMYIYIYI